MAKEEIRTFVHKMDNGKGGLSACVRSWGNGMLEAGRGWAVIEWRIVIVPVQMLPEAS